jgi:hypothetical protein
MHDIFGLTELAEDHHADLRVSTFLLKVYRFTDIMKEAGTHRQAIIDP